ncbi:hypothetical protein R1sor_012134 [Riccia sorocarpa]|uniref:t-SNARE coiled-coil homology domain-containing protein n=1 Tax=Riccia sorocarpa TaxID=122646 RepID=A0ABD3I2X4_9MARC
MVTASADRGLGREFSSAIALLYTAVMRGLGSACLACPALTPCPMPLMALGKASVPGRRGSQDARRSSVYVVGNRVVAGANGKSLEFDLWEEARRIAISNCDSISLVVDDLEENQVEMSRQLAMLGENINEVATALQKQRADTVKIEEGTGVGIQFLNILYSKLYEVRCSQHQDILR